ncbi:altronate dehydratase [Pseudolysobacter antarcticus]|uniref:Altronate dehydratase n=1 Tax=Pseudolysobacter antarcticus TaxID=2511995 RepID=A0A411HFX3_9GAMM|nr:altronate dehydratase family protein [Pseudolysobacter antarcticus]QBB69406.1 altronate dehydratase [Pseudolysobacter antarcticus]
MSESLPVSQKALRINDDDDVAVALQDLPAAERLSFGDGEIMLLAPIAAGHKFALRALVAGDAVHKYGFPIGRATSAIAAGEWVHTHNLGTALIGEDAATFSSVAKAIVVTHTPDAVRTFMGYRRADGRVGTRNEIWVLCSVGCVAHTARRVAELGAIRHAGKVDGIHAYTHVFGCSQLGDDLANTRRVLAALASHANVGGVLIVGLGCESLQLQQLLETLAPVASQRIRAFNTQQVDDEMEAGAAALDELVAIAAQDRREPCALADLVIGLKCGGSDGFSGITANPLIGRIADRIAAAGGTPILTEIPEIFGAEHLLIQRAASTQVGVAIAALVQKFKRYFVDHGQPVSENPSPGNITGGITTLEEKSLGAVQKAGSATVTQVLGYGKRINTTGLALLEAPGNDAVSSTALIAAGATILLFTTGRGTPLGFPAPTLKISSNSSLALNKPRWIDFDAGCVLTGEPIETAAERLFELILRTASGETTRNEINGERQIALWKTGVTL